MITVYSLARVPDFAKGLVRDLRVRWALEEAGISYESRLLGGSEKDSPEYRALQPWGQVPVLHDDGVQLFESGAILLHLGERDERLLPRDPQQRATAIAWLFAALNSVEPGVFELNNVTLFAKDSSVTVPQRQSTLSTL